MSQYTILNDLQSFLDLNQIKATRRKFILENLPYGLNDPEIVIKNDNGEVMFLNVDANELGSINQLFEFKFEKDLKQKISAINQLIDETYIIILESNKDAFFNYVTSTILYIKRQEGILVDFPNLEKQLDQIITYIEKKYGKIETKSILSFIIRRTQKESSQKKAARLYDMLIKSPVKMIECSKEEFIKAFTGEEVLNGINWTLKGRKNKNTIAKTSLIYLIRELFYKQHLVGYKNFEAFIQDENKILLYVFRNENGIKFTSKSISDSKQNLTPNPTAKKEIDAIIQKL